MGFDNVRAEWHAMNSFLCGDMQRWAFTIYDSGVPDGMGA